MSNRYKVAVIATALMLGAAPAVAVAGGHSTDHPTPPSNQGTAHKPSDPGSQGHHSGTPGPKASLPAKAKAYGVYCRKESRKHVAGQKGTPFSKCVTAMAKLATGKVDNPARACKDESHKHVAGQKGTPFSQCVRAAAHMKQGS